MPEPRVGLVGQADVSENGLLSASLWGRWPFDAWFVAPSPVPGVGTGSGEWFVRNSPGRRVYLYDGCHKVAAQFLRGLDVVCCVHRCWPDQLMYYSRLNCRQRTVLLAHPTLFHQRTAYWFRYASLVVAPDAATAEAMSKCLHPQSAMAVCPHDSDDLWGLIIP